MLLKMLKLVLISIIKQLLDFIIFQIIADAYDEC